MKFLNAMFILATVSSAWAQQTLAVTGDAEIMVVPDQVVMSLGIEVHAMTLPEARRENDARVMHVHEAARAAGIAEGDIQTDFIQLGMQYETDGITPKYFYTRKSVVLVLRQVNNMESVLFSVVEAGVTHIHGVTFETTSRLLKN